MLPMTMVPNAAVALLAPNLARHPDKIAVVAEHACLSYCQLDEQSARFAALLLQAGVARGDRLAFVAGDSPEYVVALLGCLKLGACAVLVNPALPAGDVAYILRDAAAVAVVADRAVLTSGCLPAAMPIEVIVLDDPAFVPLLAALPPLAAVCAPSSDDYALLLYSSGSTGLPKGVPHRHADFTMTALAYAGPVLAMTERDVVFSASKLSFAYGLGNSFSFSLFFGATVVLCSGRPDSTTVLRLINQYRVTLFFAVPIVYTMLLKTRESFDALASVRLCVSAGEALPASLCREWNATTGIELLDGLGSTEALHIYIANGPGAVRPGFAGRLLPPYQVRLVDDADQPVSRGTVGHLLLRGPTLASCYWNCPDKTRETMLPDGWFRTGDMVVEEDGWYRYQGRSDDMFKVDAQWVSPAQVEAVLLEHAAVLECAVSWRRVEGLVRPIAFAVLAGGHEPGGRLERELRRFVARLLPPHMCPVQIEWVTALPKTVTGKIQRFLLRQCA
jgi:benzoate-CoA ligase